MIDESGGLMREKLEIWEKDLCKSCMLLMIKIYYYFS